ncbi:MAG: glutaredoxin family protein [Candidatus Chaera renei]|uniref:Glutaredoxin family protein n=1 Tax=Candidatus Chaera renei TaxID=2506947 RepID=A0A4Q0AIZ9_9BACT|nr:MAG: glutaredoxin family protein [Candidatus Chaera renei]
MSDNNQKPIIIYSTAWCGFCRMARQYLDSKQVAYQDKNIEEDKAAYDELMRKIQGNYVGVPVLDIGGTIILGFDRPKIDAALAA